MGRLIAVEFVTVDGIMEGPGHDPHRDGKNAWALAITSEDQQEFNSQQIFSASAILLGRVTYQIWATFWPDAPREGGFADKINALPKYVVSKTLKEAEWNNSTVISGNANEEVAKLKELISGDIMLYGSADVVNSLTHHIDEFRLLVFPVILGSGKRLFRDETDTTHLRLVESRSFDSGVTLLSYRPARETPSSKYVEEFSWTQEQVQSLQAAQKADRVLATVLFT